MIKTGVHCRYWTGTGAENDPYRVLELTKRCGAEALDLATNIAVAMSKQERKEFAAALRGAGIAVSLNGSANPTEISDSNEDNRKAAVEEFKRAIEATADLGSNTWSGIMVAKWNRLPAEPFTADKKAVLWDNAVSSFRELCAYAQPMGVNICLEVVNRFESFLINTGADAVKLAKDVDYPNMMALLDAFHMNIEEDSTIDALKEAMAEKRLGLVHVSESNRRVPGNKKSDINWPGICKCLADGGYEGSVIIESMVSCEIPDAPSLRIWRDFTASPDLETRVAEMTTGVNYIRSLLN